ncbi:MAG: TRAP transporter large permease subunit [Enterocloster sp.]
MVVELILSVTSNRYVILLLINLILLILGMFIEVVAAIMIMLPILTPLMVIANISPIHMGVILVLNMMIGLLTPPVGMSLYMLSSASKRSFGDVVKMVSPWLIPLFIALAMVTYIEPITMFLPGLFGYV